VASWGAFSNRDYIGVPAELRSVLELGQWSDPLAQYTVSQLRSRISAALWPNF